MSLKEFQSFKSLKEFQRVSRISKSFKAFQEFQRVSSFKEFQSFEEFQEFQRVSRVQRVSRILKRFKSFKALHSKSPMLRWRKDNVNNFFSFVEEWSTSLNLSFPLRILSTGSFGFLRPGRKQRPFSNLPARYHNFLFLPF